MSTPDTDQRIKRAAIGIGVILLVAFLVVFGLRTYSAHRLDREAASAAATLPLVEVIKVQGSDAQGLLTLPGETAAWYESTIFARSVASSPAGRPILVIT